MSEFEDSEDSYKPTNRDRKKNPKRPPFQKIMTPAFTPSTYDYDPEMQDPFDLLKNQELRQNLGNDMLLFVNQVRKKSPDSLVFMDRSARPAAWMFRDIWRSINPNEEMPEIKFVNIGREKVGDANFIGRYADPSEQARYKENVKRDINKVQALKEAFTVHAKDPQGNKLETDQTYFDNKKIWIVDEYSPEGVSLMTAGALFEAAFADRSAIISEKVLFQDEPPWIMDNPHHPIQKAELIGVQKKHPQDILVSPFREDSGNESPKTLQFRAAIREIAQEAVDRFQKAA